MPLGTYLANVTVGNQGTPGAPLLHLSLVVVAPTGKVAGHGSITQAVAPPAGDIEISHVAGQIHQLGFGPNVRVVALTGHYAPSPTEPLELPFSATLVLPGEGAWEGRGSFAYGGHAVEDVPVVPAD